MGQYQALYRKYRSRTFDEVVGQSHLTDTLKRQAETGRLSHAYLFTGTRGTGKTSCAKILARAVNCTQPINGNPCNCCPSCIGIENGSILDVLELDAASNNGVDQVRALRDEAVYTPAAVKKRVYIVDEVHMLSTSAFNALLKILEEPPSHLMFILATTEIHKVPATIKSRCQQFSFKRILPTDIAQHLHHVARQEDITLSNEGATLLARLADGGMRDALSLLDQCITPDKRVGEDEILASLGLAGNLETATLMGHVSAGETAQALETLARLYASGKDVGGLLGELSVLTRDLLVRKTAPQGGAALLTGGYDEGTMRQLVSGFSPQRLVQMLTILQQTASDLSKSVNRRTDAELCLIRLCDERLDDSLAGLNARIAQLETRIASGVPVQQVTTAPSIPVSPPPQTKIVPPPVPTPVPPQERPPWEEPMAPVSAPPVAAPPVVPPAPPVPVAPAPAPAPPPPSSGGRDIWSGLVPSLQKQVPSVYPFLSNPAMVQGRLEGGLLTLWVDSEFTRGMVSKPQVLTAVTQGATAMVGSEVRCSVKIGVAPPVAPCAPPSSPPQQQPPERDNLDDLLAFGQQFDSIIIK